MSKLVPLMADPRETRVVKKGPARFRFELGDLSAYDEMGVPVEARSWAHASGVIAANPMVLWLTPQQAHRRRERLGWYRSPALAALKLQLSRPK